jgi:hypothetical protein
LSSFSGFAYDIKPDADVMNRLAVKGEAENMSEPDESEAQTK